MRMISKAAELNHGSYINNDLIYLIKLFTEVFFDALLRN